MAEGGVQVIRILLVEDDYAIARANERLIRRNVTAALEVVHVVTAEGAIAAIAFASEPFTLVVCDWNLGGVLNGGDVLTAVMKLPRPPGFLFLSSDERCGERGVEWLQKPCRPSELREAVLAFIEQPKTVKEMPLDGAFDLGGL